ncbi:alpha/beta fold hydrolase [Micromonospora sp. NPDC047074]|uniref:alpha/beta hydrolase n=1 Tax=Micromonospora sp. NPDC047074 TaxID=3154339 RepID=UPI0033D30C02
MTGAAGAPPARAADERPFYFRAGAEHIFGVLTEPTAADSGVGVLLLSGGVYVLSTNRNRLYVRMARQLAAQGHRSLRIDYRGVGESTGMIGDYPLDDPNVPDVEAAIGQLVAAGARRIVLVGSCYGARAAMHVAAGHPALASMVLLAPPLGDRGRGAAATPDEVGKVFQDRLSTLWRRRIPTLLLYGQEDNYYHDFARASAEPWLSGLFGDGSALVLRTLPGKAHGLQRIDLQDVFVDTVLDWVASVTGGDRAPAV